MAYHYLMDKEEANQKAAALAAGLVANTGKTNFVEYATGVIMRRLQSKPRLYLEFGPYWPALKKHLNEHGANLGDDLIQDASPILADFSQYEPAALIAAAENFKDLYRETWFIGTNRFVMDDDGQWWTLFDENMEAKV